METNNTPLIRNNNLNSEDTFLTEENLMLLKRIFKNKEIFKTHMETLWGLRHLALKSCECNTSEGLTYDENNPMWRIATLTNDLIGALSNDDMIFNVNYATGEVSLYDRTKK